MGDQIHNRGEGVKTLCKPKGIWVGGEKKKKKERNKIEKKIERENF
jgi:hypothetical protein